MRGGARGSDGYRMGEEEEFLARHAADPFAPPAEPDLFLPVDGEESAATLELEGCDGERRHADTPGGVRLAQAERAAQRRRVRRAVAVALVAVAAAALTSSMRSRSVRLAPAPAQPSAPLSSRGGPAGADATGSARVRVATRRTPAPHDRAGGPSRPARHAAASSLVPTRQPQEATAAPGATAVVAPRASAEFGFER